jgi:hypothetical protein
MGNSSRPGTVVVRTIPHAPFELLGVQYRVQESVWNDIEGRSFDLVRLEDEVELTDESFEAYPTEAQIAEVLEQHGIDVELERCKFCKDEVLLETAHRHDGGWVGESCCWDERLRMTE